MSRTRVYHNGELSAEDFPVDDISEHLKDESAVVWLDVCRPTAADFEKIREELGLHALAIEDATSRHERPKLDHYESHMFMTVYGVSYDKDDGDLEVHEISAFITERALITVRDDDGFDVKELTDRWDAQPDLAGSGVGFLLYGLLDAVVDGHFDALQAIDERIDGVEDVLFDENPASIREVQRRTFRIRKALGRVRKVVAPMREIANGLMRPDSDVVDETMMPYYRDVYDHVLRVAEWTESQRDFVGSMLETNATVQGNRQNTVMKKVTSWAAIIAVPTAITGFYGQNIPYPGYDKMSGFIVSSTLIIVLSFSLYFAFRRWDWL